MEIEKIELLSRADKEKVLDIHHDTFCKMFLIISDAADDVSGISDDELIDFIYLLNGVVNDIKRVAQHIAEARECT